MNLLKVIKMSYDSNEQKDLAVKYVDNLGDHFGVVEYANKTIAKSARDVPQRAEVLLGISKGKSILDIGCSTGELTLLMADNNTESVVGVDIVDELIDRAISLSERSSVERFSKVSFVCGDFYDMGFDDGEFDTIMATEFFEHLPTSAIDSFMIKAIKYLSKNGNMVISVPNREPAKKYVDEGRDRWDWPNHLTHFTKNSLNTFLKKYFGEITFLPVYPKDKISDGIWLIANCTGVKK